MALIWTESFDGPLTSTKYQTFTSGVTIDTTAGRNGKGARVSAQNTVKHIQTTNFSATDEDDVIIVGFAMKYRTTPTLLHEICQLENSAPVTHVKLKVTTDFKLQVTDGSNVTLAETSSAVLGTGQWYYIELKAKIHDTLGTVEVRTNGVTRAQASNVDTKNNTFTTVNNVRFIINQNGTITDLNSIDDIYICNEQGSSLNNFLGDVRVEGLLPSGNGNSSQWVGSDSNSTDNYALVNDANDATYVQSDIDGDKDTYVHGDLAGSTGTVLGVNQWIRANVDIVPRTVTPVARLSGTELDGTAKTMTTTLAWYSHFHQNKPGGGSWSLTNVNDAEFGYKVST